MDVKTHPGIVDIRSGARNLACDHGWQRDTDGTNPCARCDDLCHGVGNCGRCRGLRRGNRGALADELARCHVYYSALDARPANIDAESKSRLSHGRKCTNGADASRPKQSFQWLSWEGDRAMCIP